MDLTDFSSILRVLCKENAVDSLSMDSKEVKNPVDTKINFFLCLLMFPFAGLHKRLCINLQEISHVMQEYTDTF